MGVQLNIGQENRQKIREHRIHKMGVTTQKAGEYRQIRREHIEYSGKYRKMGVAIHIEQQNRQRRKEHRMQKMHGKSYTQSRRIDKEEENIQNTCSEKYRKWEYSYTYMNSRIDKEKENIEYRKWEKLHIEQENRPRRINKENIEYSGNHRKWKQLHREQENRKRTREHRVQWRIQKMGVQLH